MKAQKETAPNELPLDGALVSNLRVREDCGAKSSGETPRTQAHTKKAIVLGALLRGSLNRFEAERLGDHCLHSTVAELANRDGIAILSEWERVPTRFGREVRVKRYRASDTARDAAVKLLRRLLGLRGDACPT